MAWGRNNDRQAAPAPRQTPAAAPAPAPQQGRNYRQNDDQRRSRGPSKYKDVGALWSKQWPDGSVTYSGNLDLERLATLVPNIGTDQGGPQLQLYMRPVTSDKAGLPAFNLQINPADPYVKNPKQRQYRD